MTTPAQPSGPKINVPEGTEPVYANLARISHSPTEYVIDFGHMLPGEIDEQFLDPSAHLGVHKGKFGLIGLHFAHGTDGLVQRT